MKEYTLRKPPKPPIVKAGEISHALVNINRNYSLFLKDGTEMECNPDFYANHPCVPGNMLVATPDGAFFAMSREAFDADWMLVEQEPEKPKAKTKLQPAPDNG